MYAKLLFKHSLLINFDLMHDRELEFAYLFLHGALERTKPEGEVGTKLHAMVDALRCRIIERNEEILEAKKYPLCIRCCMEIDREKEEWEGTSGGNFQHVRCPPLKPDTRRSV